MLEIQEQIQDYRWVPVPSGPSPLHSPAAVSFPGERLSGAGARVSLSDSGRSALWGWAACMVKTTSWSWMGTPSESAK